MSNDILLSAAEVKYAAQTWLDPLEIVFIATRFVPALNWNRFLAVQRRGLNSLNSASEWIDYSFKKVLGIFPKAFSQLGLPKRQFTKCAISQAATSKELELILSLLRSRRLQWGPSAAARAGRLGGLALRLGQTWKMPLKKIAHLNSCH